MKKQSHRSQLILFVGISYAYLWILFGIGRLFDVPFSYDPRQVGGVLVLIGIPASLVGAISTTLITSGRDELRQLFSKSLHLRFPPIWALVALLTPLLVTVASTITAVLLSGAEISKNWFSPSMPFGFMIFLIIYIGLGEEIGWRGFALSRFQVNLGSLGGSVVSGILWAFWHLPLFLMPGSSQYGSSLASFIFIVTCWTIIMAFFTNKANWSVWPAILLHASVNFTAFSIRYPHQYVNLYYGISALIAAVFLPKPWFSIGKYSDTTK